MDVNSVGYQVVKKGLQQNILMQFIVPNVHYAERLGGKEESEWGLLAEL